MGQKIKIAFLVAAIFVVPIVVFANSTHTTELARASSEYWNITDANQAGLDFSSAFTFSAWLNLLTINTNFDQNTVVGKGSATSNTRQYRWSIRRDDSNGGLIHVLQASSAGSSFNGDTTVSESNVNVDVGDWHQFVVSFNSGSVKYYRNGVQVGSTQSAGISSLFNSSRPFSIGAENVGVSPTAFTNGQIDDVRVWSRVLSDSEITEMYYDPCNFDNGSSLQGWWKFDNDGGVDQSANTNDLTAVNTPTVSTDRAFLCDQGIVVNSDYTATTTLDSTRTYIFTGTINVDSGVTLTIPAGTIIKFATTTLSGLTVDGTLDVNGTGGPDSVFFTSLNDDRIGGDTNGDDDATSPSEGDWGAITINVGGNASLENAIVRYGGDGTSGAILYNNGGTLSVSTSTVTDGDSYNIRNSAGTTTIQGSELGFSDIGLYVDGGTASILATTTLHDHSSYAVFNTTGSSVPAEKNYWGDSSGPYHASNPSGLGDPVSNNVDFDYYISTSTLSFLSNPLCHSSSACGSVPEGSLLLLIDASSTPTGFLDELGMATSTWNAEGPLVLTQATSTKNVAIYSPSTSDVVWKGKLNIELSQPDSLLLNTYYLNNASSAQIQNTITHELGHAIGLDHSYTGNIMYLNQSSQTVLGVQDKSDYQLIW